MKRFLISTFTYLGLLATPFSAVSQSEKEGSNETSSVDFACKLTFSELQKRKGEIQKKVLSRVKEMEETEKSITLLFEDKDDTLMEVVHYILAEHECCPFLRFRLEIAPDRGGISWTISGTPEAKSALKKLLEG